MPLFVVLTKITISSLFYHDVYEHYWNIELSMLPSGPVVSNVYSQSEYSAGEFQVLQLIVLVVFGASD